MKTHTVNKNYGVRITMEEKRPGTEKTFASKHWESFEALSLQILNDIYKEKPNRISYLTPKKSDGGYDGILCFSNNSTDAEELYKVLLEAKLRSKGKHDLPLSDFAKTIIIAINTISDKVYISTNAFFTAETVKRLSYYQNRTGLEIRTIDIRFISDWLKNHPGVAEQFEDRELIDYLTKVNLPPNTAQQLLSPSSHDADYKEVPRLICEAQEQEVSRLHDLLKSKYGIICVQSVMGGGKSFFLERLAFTLHQNYKRIARLDLTQFSDARSVFINLLSIAWGESPSSIFSMSREELKDATQYLGDKPFPERSRRALLNIIRQPQEKFDQNQQLHSELLLWYLKQIVPPILKRVSILILISNVRKATTNALNFLCGFMRILQGTSISFLVELETQNLNCDNFLAEVQQTHSYICTLILPQWDSSTAQRFLELKMPTLNSNNRDKLIQYFGTLPLALVAGTELFKTTEIGHVLPILHTELSDSLIARTKITQGCIDYVVNNFAISSGEAIQCSLVLLGLFDGTVSKKLLEATMAQLNFCFPISQLCMCPFLVDIGECIQVVHGAYLISINKKSFISPRLLYQCLAAIEPELELYFCDKELILRKRFDIFCNLRNFQGIKKIWKNLVALYINRDEMELALKVLKEVYDWRKQNPVFNCLSDFDCYWLLFCLVQTTYAVQGATAALIPHYLEELDAVVNLSAIEDWPTGTLGLIHAHAKILNLKSMIALGKADYNNMLSFAEQGISVIKEKDDAKSLYLLGQLWANKAISLKHLRNLQACIDFLEEGKQSLSQIPPYMFCYYTHLGSQYTNSNPALALRYFKKVKEYDISLSEALHTDHNIATMYFVLGEYEQASKICSNTWVTAYENHIVIEEGRASHLLGCLEWSKGNVDNAYERFSSAYQLFQRHVHRTHLWPPLVNLSTVCREKNEKEKALIYATDAAEFLLKYHLDNINHLEIHDTAIPKMYAAILILLDHFEQLDNSAAVQKKLLREITLPNLQQDYLNYVRQNKLDGLLNGSGYLICGRRMIKI